jgi:outer membrane receptor protein involved in Fe transport
MSGFVGATEKYIGERIGDYGTSEPLPAYAEFNCRAGVRFDGGWTVSAYVNNAFDRRGVIGISGYIDVPHSFEIIPPRTIGMSVSKSF